MIYFCFDKWVARALWKILLLPAHLDYFGAQNSDIWIDLCNGLFMWIMTGIMFQLV